MTAVPSVGASSVPESTDPGRRRAWLALAAATVPLTVCFWSAVVAFVAAADGAGAPAGSSTPAASAALAAALAPVTLAVLALGSGHPRPLWAASVGAVGGLSAGVVVLAVSGDVTTGLVAGFGLAVAASLARRPGAPSPYARRLGAVALAASTAFVLAHTVTFLALASGPALCVVAVGLADDGVRRRGRV